MYTNNCHIFFVLRAHLFVLAPLSETSDGIGIIRPLGSRCRRFGRDPCSVCRAWQGFDFFLALSTLEANTRVSAASSGIGFPNPLSPGTHVRFGCKPGFSAPRRVHVRFPIFAESTTLRPCRPEAVQPPSSSSSLQLCARVAAVVVADCFDRSL